MESNEFDKLSRGLNLSERQELLDKINDKSNQVDDFYQENNKTNQSHLEIQKQTARKEYQLLSLFEKIGIILNSLFSGQSKEDILIQKKINKIKKQIQDINPIIVNFEKKQLTYQFCNFLLSLSKYINDLQTILETYFSNNDYFFNFLKESCQTTFSDKMKTFYNDCLPQNSKFDTNAILDNYIYTKERDKRINRFLNLIDEDSLNTFILDLNCFEKLKKVITFNFKDLLVDFSYAIYDEPPTVKNFAQYSNISQKIEYLNSILASINFSSSNIMFLNDYVEYMKKNPLTQAMGAMNKTLTTQDTDKFASLLESITRFVTKVPLTQIVQYFKRDYLYQPRQINQKSNFVQTYKNNMKTYFNTLWDENFIKLKQTYLSQLLKDLYPDFHFDTLSNCNEKIYKQVNEFLKIKLTAIYHLNFIMYYVSKFYKGSLEAAVNRILIDGDFVTEQFKFHLSAVYHSMNNNLQKINDFNNLMGIDQEYGKKILFYISKFSRNEEQELTGTATLFLKEIHTESMAIVNDFVNSITNLQNFFASLMSIQSRGERQIKNLDMINLGVSNNIQYVEKINTNLVNFFKIYRYINEVY